MFVIKKKSGKWRLLQDLRAVNAVMEDMGALQPGLPSPVAVPKGWHTVVIDLQDCFFTIKLNPEDRQYFAFSVPSVNFKRPFRRYQWKVLPQGMKNSPTLCQKYVDQALQAVRSKFGSAYIVHYMDDILMATSSIKELEELIRETIQALTEKGLIIAPDKVQKEKPITYLGHILYHDYIASQKVAIRRDKLLTLNDMQKLLGEINWIRGYLKITTGTLSPLFQILHGDPDPKSPRTLTEEALVALKEVEKAIGQAKVGQLDYTKPWQLLIFNTEYTPTACLWQGGVLEWLHLAHAQKRIIADYPYLCSLLIMKGRLRSRELFGIECKEIIVPYSKAQHEYLMQTSVDWTLALQNYIGDIKHHYPRHPLIEFVKRVPLIFPSIISLTPLEGAVCIFTDGSSNGTAAVYSSSAQPLQKATGEKSAQRAEIHAVILALESFPQPCNLYTDSCYIANLFPSLETALLSGSSTILPLLQQLQQAVQSRENPLFVGHIRGHTKLPGPLAFGNSMADRLTKVIIGNIVAAEKSHQLHHQNANALRKMFHITREQARHIVKECKACPPSHGMCKMGVNPRGLKPNILWQMDVTHIPGFGKLAYVHVSIDTFSHFVVASAHAGEALKDVIQHLSLAFSIMGKPQQIKTDNGPAYTSKGFAQFCDQWGIQHYTGIPYNPQGQAIIERAHQVLKGQIQKLQVTHSYYSPHQVLTHSLFVLNHLNTSEEGETPAQRHWGDLKTPLSVKVLWKDLLTGTWKGPDPLISSGRGYACVFPQDATSPIWIPDRLIRPAPQESEREKKKTVEEERTEPEPTTKENET